MNKYTPLAEFLSHQSDPEVRLSFGEIERVIGNTLPPTALNHRAWWGNQRAHRSHPWATEWMAAGLRCETVSLTGQWTLFRRTNEGT